MVGVVEPEAAHDADLLAGERREEVLHGEHLVRDLRGGVEGAADDLVRLDGLPLVDSQSHCFRRIVGITYSCVTVLTIQFGVHGLSDMNLSSLRRHKADEASPLLYQNGVIKLLCGLTDMYAPF